MVVVHVVFNILPSASRVPPWSPLRYAHRRTPPPDPPGRREPRLVKSEVKYEVQCPPPLTFRQLYHGSYYRAMRRLP